MQPTGSWLGVKVNDGGGGYEDGEQPLVYLKQTPSTILSGAVVTVSSGRVVSIALPPELLQAGSRDEARGMPPALAQALTAAIDSPNGRLAVAITPPRLSSPTSRGAAADLLAEFAVASLNVTDGGSGFLADEPPTISVRAPVGSAAAAVGDVDKAKFREAVLAAPRLSPRAVDDHVLGDAALKQLSRDLLAAQDGLSLPVLEPQDRVTVELLPPGVVPRLVPAESSSSDSRYVLPIDVAAGSFGTSAAKPVEAKAQLSGAAAARIFAAGGLCSSAAHTLLVPLDVVKTRLQASDPPEFRGPADAARGIVAQDGAAGLLRGADTTALGYLVFGALAFGLEEVFFRFAKELAGSGNALLFGTPLLFGSAAAATTISTIAVCPFETVRIRSVAQNNPDSLSVLRELLLAEGPPALFAGLVPILLKDVPSFVTKILVFDASIGFTTSLSTSLFGDANVGLASVAPSLLAGAIAGVVSALVTQPSDTLLTACSKGGIGLPEAFAKLKAQPELVVRGLSTRLVFKALCTSIQFLLLAKIRELFGVSNADITYIWDVLDRVLSPGRGDS